MLCKCFYYYQVISLIISDVIGDKLDIIASGPTVRPEPSKLTCKQVLVKYKLLNLLPDNLNIEESGHMSEDIFRNVANIIFSNNTKALEQAEIVAKQVCYLF